MTLAEFIRMFAALAITLALVGAAFWTVRRFGLTNAGGRKGAPAPGPIRIVDRQILGPGRSLVVVRWGGADHLIGLGPAFCTPIAQRAHEAADPADMAGSRGVLAPNPTEPQP